MGKRERKRRLCVVVLVKDSARRKQKKETMAAATKASAMSARALFKKGAPAKKGTQPTKKKFSFGGSGKPQVNKTSVSQQKFGRELWLPNTEPPEWLDGSLPGDRGFDPLGLAKPAEFIQMSADALDQNA